MRHVFGDKKGADAEPTIVTRTVFHHSNGCSFNEDCPITLPSYHTRHAHCMQVKHTLLHGPDFCESNIYPSCAFTRALAMSQSRNSRRGNKGATFPATMSACRFYADAITLCIQASSQEGKELDKDVTCQPAQRTTLRDKAHQVPCWQLFSGQNLRLKAFRCSKHLCGCTQSL